MIGARGILLEPLPKEVRKYLESEQKAYAEKDERIFKKTAWMRLSSNADEVYVNRIKVDPQEWVLAGGLVKSRKAGGSGTGRESKLPGPPYTEKLSGWTNEGFGTQYAGNRRNLPRPGINNVTVSTQGKNGTLTKATINITIPYERDLEVIEKLYMVPGVTCILEWGWSNTLAPPFQVGQGETYDSVQKRIVELVNNTFAGDYCAILGTISKFSYGASNGGGYEGVVELLSHGYTTSIRPIKTNILPNVPQRRDADTIEILEKDKFQEFDPSTGRTLLINPVNGNEVASISDIDQTGGLSTNLEEGVTAELELQKTQALISRLTSGTGDGDADKNTGSGIN